METLFEHAGGDAALLQFCDVFHREVLADPHLPREVPLWEWPE
jgi:truncated hemoglobin YjbI